MKKVFSRRRKIHYISEEKEKSDKAVEDVLDGSEKGEPTKGRTKQFDKPGDFDDALEDFDKMGLSDVEDRSENGKIVKIGKLPDGRNVNVRNKSKRESRPTLEIQEGKKRVKIRYIN